MRLGKQELHDVLNKTIFIDSKGSRIRSMPVAGIAAARSKGQVRAQ
jgi:hypothetical protein